MHDLKKFAPLLERVPQTLRGIPMSKASKVERKKTRVEGRSTEVGALTDVCEVGKVYVVPAAWKVRLGAYGCRVETAGADLPFRGLTSNGQIQDQVDDIAGESVHREYESDEKKPKRWEKSRCDEAVLGIKGWI